MCSGSEQSESNPHLRVSHETAVLTVTPYSVLKGMFSILRGCGPQAWGVPSLWVLSAACMGWVLHHSN